MSAATDLASGDVLQVRVRALASSGAGVADLPDGRVVFVHRTAPEDEVEVRLNRLRPRWGTAWLRRLLSPGGSRVEAPCRLYQDCGGCTLQHVDYPDQLEWKSRFVTDALERIGKVRVPLPTVAPSPGRFHYRNRVTFTLRRLRDAQVVAGFHGLEHPDNLVDIEGECLLPEEPIIRAWEGLRAAWGPGARALPKGRELRLTLRLTEDGVVLFVKGGEAGWASEGLLDRVQALVSVWHQSFGEEAPHLVEGSQAFDYWGDDRLPVAGRAFLQVNREAAEQLKGRVLAQAPPEPGSGVDGYCGAGVYGRALAERGWSMIGVELEPEACTAAREECPSGFRVVEGRVEKHLDSLLPADFVVLNPPRTGLDSRVPEILLTHPPPRIAYVSCDPATLARDIGRLSSLYRPTHVESFDLFPQTAHVETLAVLDLAMEL